MMYKKEKKKIEAQRENMKWFTLIYSFAFLVDWGEEYNFIL